MEKDIVAKEGICNVCECLVYLDKAWCMDSKD